MRVFVLQKHQDRLNFVKKFVAEIKEKALNEIFYTSNPNEVAEKISDGEPSLVISGTSFTEGSIDEDELAKRLKVANKKSIFLLYSAYDKKYSWADGLIPKLSTENPDQVIARIATSDLTGVTIQSLKKSFREIK